MAASLDVVDLYKKRLSQPAGVFGNYDASTGFNRDATLANNAYSRFLAQQRYGRDWANLNIGQDRGIEKMGATLGRRGLQNSGLAGEAQTNYATNWMNQQQNLNDSLYEQLRQLSMSDANAWNQFDNSQANAAFDRQNQIQQTAAQLQALKSYMG